MAYDELTARLAKQVSQLEQALAEKDREIAKWRRIRTPTHGTCCTCRGITVTSICQIIVHLMIGSQPNNRS